MYLIAGLGNPTLKYSHTRHNVGFDALDLFAKQYRIPVKKKHFLGLYGEGVACGAKTVLLKPHTYMNRSGESILMALNAYNINPQTNLIVLVDDITLPCGAIRIRPGGSAGGHNGLKNIIALTGSEKFIRIRIGAGKMPEGADMIKYVLSRPTGNDRKLLKEAYEDVVGAIELLLKDGVEAAMNAYNGKQKGKDK